MRSQDLSISPTRRKTGSAYYEFPIYSPNRWQMETTVRRNDRRHKRFPWFALAMLVIGTVGLIGLMISISQ